VPTRPTSAQQILGENAELNARLKLAESIAAQRSSELEALKKEMEQLRAERTRYCERVVLLEEELSWIKSRWTCPVPVDSFLSSLLGDLCLYLPPSGILQRRAVWRRRRQKRRVLSWRSRVPVSPFVIDRRSIANG
jgi:hypothetical protein